ncbi:MAG: response regulator transcription factor [Anaerolineae bacterium]
MNSIRVLIADDHLVVREGLRLILESGEGFEVVGEAADGAEAVRLAGEQQPDVTLMDLRMPGMDGLEAIERIRAQWPDIAVVILTTYNEDELMMRGLGLGARGYLLKDTGRAALFDTIRAAARGETLLGPEIMSRLLAHTAAPPPIPRRAQGIELTERELQVLRAVAQGEKSKEIAAGLQITERTVKAHLDSIYNKLGVDSRAAAVSTASQRGLI